MNTHVIESKTRWWVYSVVLLAVVAGLASSTRPVASAGEYKKMATEFTSDFRLDACTFASTGSNEYFILEPGYQLVLAGEEKDTLIELEITVLNDTMLMDGIETRVVEEQEWEDEMNTYTLNAY